jgi:hypothetical protein
LGDRPKTGSRLALAAASGALPKDDKGDNDDKARWLSSFENQPSYLEAAETAEAANAKVWQSRRRCRFVAKLIFGDKMRLIDGSSYWLWSYQPSR